MLLLSTVFFKAWPLSVYQKSTKAKNTKICVVLIVIFAIKLGYFFIKMSVDAFTKDFENLITYASNIENNEETDQSSTPTTPSKI